MNEFWKFIGHEIADDIIVKGAGATKNLQEDIDQEAQVLQALAVLGHILQDPDPAQGIEVETDISQGWKNGESWMMNMKSEKFDHPVK